ncbi:MAG: glucose-6-phosphate isomerase [Burkholderiales bacterium]|nr:glucose-6-phosphate isomerase [Burkholderiales bacterium]
MSFIRCDQTVAWAALQGHWQAHGRDLDLRTLFAADPTRVDRLTIQAPGVLGDLSRAKWDVATARHLFDLARECRLPERRDAMFRGDVVNCSEGRAALHTALRAPKGRAPFSEQVHAVLDRMLAFVEQIRASAGGSQAGDIHDVVNIGIGGSDLGPQMVVPALDPFVHPRLRFHFVSNVDGHDLAEVLRQVDARHTLFIVASKTFTTLETMANALAAKQWFLDQGGQDIARHFVATTTNVDAAAAFGITTTFGFWDWVGGRFSMWSPIGLPIALALGAEHFKEMLAGAHAMDEHFASAPLASNLPMCLGLLDVWYRNFHGYASRCVAPYHHGLRRLPTYLQQLVMESNGKGVDSHGQALTYSTSEVVWGEPGTNGQHAFFQMLHQGTDVIPVDFILIKRPTYGDEPPMSAGLRRLLDQQHVTLLANGVAQAQALMWGKGTDEAEQEARPPTASATMPARELALQRTFPGNRPSLTLVLDQLNPRSLGALVALYEHRTFVTGALWGINSFDQWGVELGKVLCKDVAARMQSGDVSGVDAATAAMIQRLR